MNHRRVVGRGPAQIHLDRAVAFEKMANDCASELSTVRSYYYCQRHGYSPGEERRLEKAEANFRQRAREEVDAAIRVEAAVELETPYQAVSQPFPVRAGGPESRRRLKRRSRAG